MHPRNVLQQLLDRVLRCNVFSFESQAKSMKCNRNKNGSFICQFVHGRILKVLSLFWKCYIDDIHYAFGQEIRQVKQSL